MHIRDLKRKENLKVGDMVAFHSHKCSSWVRGVVEKTNMNKGGQVCYLSLKVMYMFLSNDRRHFFDAALLDSVNPLRRYQKSFTYFT